MYGLSIGMLSWVIYTLNNNILSPCLLLIKRIVSYSHFILSLCSYTLFRMFDDVMLLAKG